MLFSDLSKLLKANQRVSWRKAAVTGRGRLRLGTSLNPLHFRELGYTQRPGAIARDEPDGVH